MNRRPAHRIARASLARALAAACLVLGLLAPAALAD
jgi:hypothetical protein